MSSSQAAMAKPDPTKTTMLRRRFERELARRFRALRVAIRKGIQENDALGLKANVNAPGRGAFDYPRSSDKINAFMEWLREAQGREILSVTQGTPVREAAEQAWTRVYVETAYQKGIAEGAAKMRKGGAEVADRWVSAAFNRPIHADRIGLIYTRTFDELKGITEAMDAQISRALAQGIAEGRSAPEVAKMLTDRVNKIGITRAKTLARTEVVRASQQASLNTFREAGLEGVDVEVEVGLAADPCPICEDLAASAPYTLNEFERLFPAHPNCRCAPVPRVKKGVKLE